MTATEPFLLTAQHLKLLRNAHVDWDATEYGAPAIDPKRPYGNGDVEADVCRLLGWNKEGDDGSQLCWSSRQRQTAMSIHRGTETALQIILALGVWPLPGMYRRIDRYDAMSWRHHDCSI